MTREGAVFVSGAEIQTYSAQVLEGGKDADVVLHNEWIVPAAFNLLHYMNDRIS